MDVNILGSVWKVLWVDETECPVLKDSDGCTDPSIKTIYIDRYICDRKEPDDQKNTKWHEAVVIRHEIIHAFLYESGLWVNSSRQDHWAMNEEMVDWMAIQLPKIVKACVEVEQGIDS